MRICCYRHQLSPFKPDRAVAKTLGAHGADAEGCETGRNAVAVVVVVGDVAAVDCC